MGMKFVGEVVKEGGWGIDGVGKDEDWRGKYWGDGILEEGGWNEVKGGIDAELKGLGGKRWRKKRSWWKGVKKGR
ncbi:hypothetical protein [Bacillus subtilis]|uniref:hypothetical protein n=1 Tax=Bacillus subtilis TaxID=1423 RepID=UPI0011A33FB8